MQTFLPLPSYCESAKCLDRLRLGKQRVEVKQILSTLLGKSRGWANHPAVRMWRGYESSLILYGLAVCLEWRKRGYKDSVLEHLLLETLDERCAWTESDPPDAPKPPWLGDPSFHASHRSNLLRKDPQHYSQFGWTEPDSLPYVWPGEKQ